MTYVTCKILGPSDTNFGLGNQLFNVATAISLAKDNNCVATFPCLNDIKKYGDYKYNIFQKLNTFEVPNIEWNFFVEETFGYKKIQFKNNLMLKGYFQSEKYFRHNRELILETLYNDEIIYHLKHKYKSLLELDNPVSVHIRRGDYLKFSTVHTNLAETEYYNKCFNLCGLDSNFVFFSDDIEWCKKEFSFLKNSHFIEKDKDYNELILMSLFRINIIANSTFSWWAAWLNDNQDKIILCPQQWFDKDGPKKCDDLYCEGWLKI